jgi:hypothetical protein
LKEDLAERLEFSFRDYTVSRLLAQWSFWGASFWAVVSTHERSVQHFEHFDVTHSRRMPAHITNAATNYRHILKLQKSLKPLPGIWHWPASCNFACVSAPSEHFAGARRTSGQEPRPPILTASLRRAAM